MNTTIQSWGDALLTSLTGALALFFAAITALDLESGRSLPAPSCRLNL